MGYGYRQGRMHLKQEVAGYCMNLPGGYYLETLLQKPFENAQPLLLSLLLTLTGLLRDAQGKIKPHTIITEVGTKNLHIG